VRSDKEPFTQLRLYLTNLARQVSVEDLVSELRSFSFPTFAPVRRQLFFLVRRVNELRRVAGLEGVPPAAVVPSWAGTGG
jgi:hypothetical protein